MILPPPRLSLSFAEETFIPDVTPSRDKKTVPTKTLRYTVVCGKIQNRHFLKSPIRRGKEM